MVRKYEICAVCGHEVLVDVDDYVEKEHLRKIVVEMRKRCPKQSEPVLDHAIHNGRQEVLREISKMVDDEAYPSECCRYFEEHE